jgi:beta-lactamase superfamily II metal-dependent hydrolase
MKIKKIIIFILTLLLAVVLAYFSFDTVTQVEQPDKTKLNVHFIDVGQADCMLITTLDDKTMLIDAGNNADGDDVVNYIKKQGIDTIDVLIGTHPHEDHIGGMDDVIKNFNIGKFYMPRAANNTKTFEDVLDAAQEKGLKITAGKAGMNIGLSDSVNAEILAPNSETYKDLNNYSIVVKLTYKQDSFLFMGDAEKQSENEILDKGYDISTDVLKIGHHGSSTSTSENFLKAVSPNDTVICVGKGNDYGHPHKETMKLLKDYGLTVYRTDECGTIIATSDGSGITFNVKPGDYKYHSK